MNTSLNKKLFICFALLVLFVILLILALNTTVSETYYIYSKKTDLSELFYEINKIYSNNDYSTNPTFIEKELEKIDSKKNLDIVVQNGREITIYSTAKDFSQNKFFLSELNRTLSLNNDYFDKFFTSDVKYFTDIVKDNNINSDFVFLFGKLDNNFNIFMRTPVESIRESVAITNKFLVIIGFFALVSSACIALADHGL